MPDLTPSRRKSDEPHGAHSSHRCVRCREALVLVRTHVSPARLGTPVTTDFYQCGACDSGWALNVATGKWKPWESDEA